MPLPRKKAAPAQLQPAGGRVVVNLFGDSAIELLVTQYGDGPGYVLSVDGTLLVGLTAKSAAAWIEVLQVIANPGEEEVEEESLAPPEEVLNEIAEELTRVVEAKPAELGDEYSRGKQQGLIHALSLIQARTRGRKGGRDVLVSDEV